MHLKFTVNNKAVEVEVAPNTLLVQALRENLQLTGTHVGCDTAQCGACTVSDFKSRRYQYKILIN